MVEASVPDLHFDTASLKNLTSSVNLANTIAISLDHRLSPEHPYQLLI
jgi:acetyl esterase/lipase